MPFNQEESSFTYQAFDAFVDRMGGEFIEDLIALCRIPSIAVESGPAMLAAAELVGSQCERAGLSVRVVHRPDNRPTLLAEGGTGDRGLLIYNHYDVQPPDPLREWHSPPFEPTRRGDMLIARGVCDDKANLVARLCAARAYRETIGPLPVRLLCVIEGEEEIGSPHIEELARDNARLLRTMDGCVWESGYKGSDERPIVTLGLKGLLAIELHAQTAGIDAPSKEGGLFPNAVWRLVEALNTLRAPDGRITIDGLAEHVYPPSEAQMALLKSIPFDAQATLRTYGLRGFLGGLTGIEALRRTMFEPALSINGITGGYTGPGIRTIIPARASARLDLRLVPALTPDLAESLLREHLARRGFTDVQVTAVGPRMMPADTDPSEQIVLAALAAIRDVCRAEPVVHPIMPGGGPMHALCQAHGIPTVAFGVGWAGSQVHGPDESIRIGDFVEGIKVMGRLIHEFGNRP